MTHYLAQGSLAGAPDDAANLEGSKPVRLGLGAIVNLWWKVRRRSLLVQNDRYLYIWFVAKKG